MSAVLDVDESTLTRRYAQVIKKGREQGTMSLKRKQYELAMNGNPTMLIWLGKIMLGQRDYKAIEISGPDGGAIETSSRKQEIIEEFENLVKLKYEPGKL